MSRSARYLTLSQAARRLGVAERTLAAWIAAGRFPGYRTPGGHYRIAAEDLPLALEPARRRPSTSVRDGLPRGS